MLIANSESSKMHALMFIITASMPIIILLIDVINKDLVKHLFKEIEIVSLQMN